MGKDVALAGPRPLIGRPVKPKINLVDLQELDADRSAEIIEILEALIARAQDGDLKAIHVVTLSRSRGFESECSQCAMPLEMAGALSIAQQAYARDVFILSQMAGGDEEGD